jgi:hypothetical protein
MAVLLYGPTQVRIAFDGNHFMAHLHAATSRRFADCRGYFLTIAGTNDSRKEVCISYWIHPSIPLLFCYDTHDDTGEPSQTVEVNDENVDALVQIMDRPIGILWGFSADLGRYLPFTDSETPSPIGDA